MRNGFTAIIEWGEDWNIAHCPEMPGVHGPGKTGEDARGNLAG